MGKGASHSNGTYIDQVSCPGFGRPEHWLRRDSNSFNQQKDGAWFALCRRCDLKRKQFFAAHDPSKTQKPDKDPDPYMDGSTVPVSSNQFHGTGSRPTELTFQALPFESNGLKIPSGQSDRSLADLGICSACKKAAFKENLIEGLCLKCAEKATAPTQQPAPIKTKPPKETKQTKPEPSRQESYPILFTIKRPDQSAVNLVEASSNQRDAGVGCVLSIPIETMTKLLADHGLEFRLWAQVATK